MNVSANKSKGGFTLLELLLTLAIVAILLSVSALGLQTFRQRLELRAAQRNLVMFLNEARSDSRRLSLDQSLSWNADEGTLELASGSEVQTLNLSAANVVFAGADAINYSAPYGRVSATNDIIRLKHNRLDAPATVIVYGVTGKVKAVGR